MGLTWTATDYERRDDKGVPMPVKEQPANIANFPVASYVFVDVESASGDIVVKP